MVSKCTDSSGCSGPRHSLHYSCGCEFRQLLLLVKGSSFFWHSGAEPLSYTCREPSLYSLRLPIRLKCKCAEKLILTMAYWKQWKYFAPFLLSTVPCLNAPLRDAKLYLHNFFEGSLSEKAIDLLQNCGRFGVHACKLLQSYPILCHPMDCSQPGSSVYGIL